MLERNSSTAIVTLYLVESALEHKFVHLGWHVLLVVQVDLEALQGAETFDFGFLLAFSLGNARSLLSAHARQRFIIVQGRDVGARYRVY